METVTFRTVHQHPVDKSNALLAVVLPSEIEGVWETSHDPDHYTEVGMKSGRVITVRHSLEETIEIINNREG